MCRVLVWGFGVAYVAALLLLLVGTFGLFGNERDPLAGVFLIPLGLPWILVTGRLPDAIRPSVAALTPLINFAILVWLCRRWGGGTR